MKKFSALFCGLVSFFVISVALGQSEQGLFNEDEAKAAWKKMASLTENCSGEIVTYYAGLPNTGGRFIEAKEEFQKNDGGRCFKTTLLKQKKNTQNGELVPYKVLCTNKENLFSLRSAGEDKSEGEWSVSEVRPSGMPLDENPVLQAERDSRGRFMYASHAIRGIPLEKLWGDTNFSIKSVVPDSANSSLINISCHWVVPNELLPPKQKGAPSISPNVEVTLTLNSKSFWRIEKVLTVLSESKDGKTTKMFSSSYPEYQLSEEGIPYVVKVSEYTSRDHYVEKAMPVYVGEITYKSFAPSPESDFRLSYYGFPEPDFGEKISWIRYAALAVSAIGFFLVVFALWSMYCKRKKRNGEQDAET